VYQDLVDPNSVEGKWHQGKVGQKFLSIYIPSPIAHYQKFMVNTTVKREENLDIGPTGEL